MIKAVVDTNLFVRAMLKGKITAPLLDAWRDNKFILIFSEPTIEEIFEVLYRPRIKKAITDNEIEELRNLIEEKRQMGYALLVDPGQKLQVSKDPDDDMFIECAVEAKADYIITGDKEDLLSLQKYENIEIISVTKFLEILKAKESTDKDRV
ncbi:putative toxin-antitoxin system toxin component, PIN family [bacterium]|nr:putative toxin-antitoxin system toxin component, PIN family [bacterium]